MNLEKKLFTELSQIIEQGKSELRRQVNSTITMVYWQVGRRINEDILNNKRAEYATEVVSILALQLEEAYGRGFGEKNLRRMMKFSLEFPSLEIVATLSRQLSWSHFVELLKLKADTAKMYYANQIAEEKWSVRETRYQIERKAFERQEIANIQFPVEQHPLQNTFKDPYLLDFLGLKDGYLETDLEGAILKELEHFILEMGKGFAFVERQKRLIIDGEDFYLDLLFFHRKLKRLVAIELKLGKFKASYKGQIELYLKWLDRYERQEGEESPIGLILCAEKSHEQIELLEMGRDGIMVAEYLTELPPKKVLEAKLHSAYQEAQNMIEQRNSFED